MLSNLKSIEENKEYLKSVIGVNVRHGIDWINSVGCEIEYKYNWNSKFTEGVLKIAKHEPENKKIYFEGYEKGIKICNLTRCKIGGILGLKSSEFKYEIGNTMNYLTVTDREYRKDKGGQNRKYYKYKCNNCGNEDWIIESNLKQGKGCNACCPTPRKAVLGINTIYDKAIWMIDLGVSIEDAKTHTPSSSEEIYVVCPDCKRTKKITPNKIQQTHSIGCSCGDGISYPEKLMESVLIQLNIDYERQYKIDKFRYDFYLPKYNVIIEVHGGQHGQFIKNGDITLVKRTKGFGKKDEIKNDADKCWVAYKSEIECYIPIDSIISDLQYIKSNMIDSKLNELLDLNKIDWIKCGEYASSNLVKEICVFYNQHPGILTTDLAKKFNMTRNTIVRYLKTGMELEWCKYDSKKEMARNGKHAGKLNSKPVLQFTLKGEFIKTYPSTHEAERQTGISNSHISNCCKGKRKTAGGYCWRYVEE